MQIKLAPALGLGAALLIGRAGSPQRAASDSEIDFFFFHISSIRDTLHRSGISGTSDFASLRFFFRFFCHCHPAVSSGFFESRRLRL